MVIQNRFRTAALAFLLILTTVLLFSCSPTSSTAGPLGDSRIIGQAKAIHKNVSSFPYQLDFLVLSTEDIGTLPNPTKACVGATITAETNENIRTLEPEEKFTANVKWALDNTNSIPVFYMYNIKELR
jgi:hypothetical protein